MPRAKVFVSCGQKEQPTRAPLDELGIARDLAARLRDANYEVYVSIDERSVAGMVEDIFKNLKDSEYCLFIDFEREELASEGQNQPQHRGSLFTIVIRLTNQTINIGLGGEE